MGLSARFPDNIPVLVRASATTATLAATNGGRATAITLGGMQYVLSATLTLDITTSGAGGVDTGAFGSAHQLYYIYAVATSAGVVSLVASLSATSPTGFTTRFKLVGALYASDSALTIGGTVSITGAAESEWQNYTMVIGASTTPPTLPTAAPTQVSAWRRLGSNMQFRSAWRFGGDPTGSNAGSGAYRFPLPTGFTINTAILPSSLNTIKVCGISGVASNRSGVCAVEFNAVGQYVYIHVYNPGGADFALVSSTFQPVTVANQDYSLDCVVPITGWKATLL